MLDVQYDTLDYRMILGLTIQDILLLLDSHKSSRYSVRTSTLVDGRAVGENGEKQGLYRIHSKQMFYVWYT